MKLRTVMAAAPVARKLWRWTPSPLRLPVAALAAGAAVWYAIRGRDGEAPATDD